MNTELARLTAVVNPNRSKADWCWRLTAILRLARLDHCFSCEDVAQNVDGQATAEDVLRLEQGDFSGEALLPVLDLLGFASMEAWVRHADQFLKGLSYDDLTAKQQTFLHKVEEELQASGKWDRYQLIRAILKIEL